MTESSNSSDAGASPCPHDWRVSPWVVPNSVGGQLCVCALCSTAQVLYLGLTDAVASWPRAGIFRG